MDSKSYDSNSKRIRDINDECANETIEGKIVSIESENFDGQNWSAINLVDSDDGIVCIAPSEYISQVNVMAGQTVQVQGSVRFYPKFCELVLFAREIKKISPNIEWENCYDKVVEKILAYAGIDSNDEKITTDKAFCAIHDYYADLGLICRNAYVIMLIEKLLRKTS